MQRADAFDATATQHNTAVSPPNHYDQGRGSGSADGKLADGLLAQLSQDVTWVGSVNGSQPVRSPTAMRHHWINGPPRTRGHGVDVWTGP